MLIMQAAMSLSKMALTLGATTATPKSSLKHFDKSSGRLKAIVPSGRKIQDCVRNASLAGIVSYHRPGENIGIDGFHQSPWFPLRAQCSAMVSFISSILTGGPL